MAQYKYQVIKDKENGAVVYKVGRLVGAKIFPIFLVERLCTNMTEAKKLVRELTEKRALLDPHAKRMEKWNARMKAKDAKRLV